jgi:aminoglycoside phosphotransferase family enzyme/predicted kinase
MKGKAVMTTPQHTNALVQWLERPEAYPHRPESVQRIETHISQVFLAGPYVYKLKKPVKFSFLDFTTLAARERACREEVRLNRRLAEGAYLGTVPVTRDATGQFTLDGDGEVVDWLVHMRRLREDRMLDRLHGAGKLRPEQIDQLSELLARFYASAPRAPYTPQEYLARCQAHVRENRDSLCSALPANLEAAVDRTHGFQMQLLSLQPQLFMQRGERGLVVEGHGDLRAEHICLDDPIAIFDCIEFQDEFRYLDVADELAFLAADCDFIGATWVGPQLFERYSRRSGDQPEPELLAFYKAYRASVRAKVAALRASQQDGPAKDESTREAERHLELAGSYVPPSYRPLLIAVGGLSGTGKTTLARSLCEALAAQILRSDVVRQELFASAVAGETPDAEKYSQAGRSRVYEELFRRAERLLDLGVSVVLDATFAQAGFMSAAQELAKSHDARFLAVECWCPPEIALQRISQRLQAGTDASEAHAGVYRQQAQSWAPWPASVPQTRIDTTMPLEDQRRAVLSTLASVDDGRLFG